MCVFIWMMQRTVRKRALTLMFVLAAALAGVAALAASVPAKAVPTNGAGRFFCVKDDLEVSTIAGPGVGDLRQQGFTCTPLRAL